MPTRIRITTDLLEYMLDLPANIAVTGVQPVTEVEGVRCIVFEVDVAGGEANGPSGIAGDGLFALQYENDKDSVPRLVSAIQVPE